MRAAQQIRPQRYQQAATKIVAEHHRPNEFLAAAAFLFSHRQRSGNHGAARMRLGDRLDIVGLVGMGAHCVGERGVDRGGAEVGSDHRGLRLAAEPANILHRHDAGRHARARHHGAEGVENPVLARHRDDVRQRLIPGRGHVACEPRGDVSVRRGCGASGRKGRHDSEGASRLQHLAARRQLGHLAFSCSRPRSSQDQRLGYLSGARQVFVLRDSVPSRQRQLPAALLVCAWIEPNPDWTSGAAGANAVSA